MTETRSSARSGPIEPIHLSTRVRRPIADAFHLFTERIETWWPVRTHYARGTVVGVVFEGRVGGRIYERCADGETADWGEVLAWEPPRRVVFSWHPNPNRTALTEIEVRFTAEEAQSTRVEIEHRGWERLGELAIEARDRYLNGWPTVWGRFKEVAGAVEDSVDSTSES